MSSTVSGIRGGQPSITQPIATPWLSPKVVTRNMWPKVLKDMPGCRLMSDVCTYAICQRGIAHDEVGQIRGIVIPGRCDSIEPGIQRLSYSYRDSGFASSRRPGMTEG